MLLYNSMKKFFVAFAPTGVVLLLCLALSKFGLPETFKTKAVVYVSLSEYKQTQYDENRLGPIIDSIVEIEDGNQNLVPYEQWDKILQEGGYEIMWTDRNVYPPGF
jgi:hypothetical protein